MFSPAAKPTAAAHLVSAVVTQQLHGDALEAERLGDRRAHVLEQLARVPRLVQRAETPSRRSSASRFAFARPPPARTERRAPRARTPRRARRSRRRSGGGPKSARRRRGCRAARLRARIGANSASSGCHAVGSSVTARSGCTSAPSLPVELALRHEVRAALQEPLVEQRLPVATWLHLAEQRLARLVAAVDGRDDEVVPFAAVEVDHDRAEPERVRDGPRDRREELRKLLARADEARDFEQAAEPREDRGLTQVEGGHCLQKIGSRQVTGLPSNGGAWASDIGVSACSITSGSCVAQTTAAPVSRARRRAGRRRRSRSRRRAARSARRRAGARARRDRAGDRDARTLALREPRDALGRALARARPSRAPRARRPRLVAAAQRERELDVLERGQVRHEPRLLADVGDLLAASARAPPGRARSARRRRP